MSRLLSFGILFLVLTSILAVNVAAQEDSCGFFCRIVNFFSNIFSRFTGSAVLDAASAPFIALDDENKTISISVKVAKG